ncbi:MAG: hypothetical protein WD669_12895 [Pirellulales bacterium]
MNRALILPAGCCLVAFAALLATLSRATGQQSRPSTEVASASVVPKASRASQVSDGEAHELLSALADKYVGPWRQWEASPSRMYSRVGPRPISPVSTQILVASHAKGQSDSFLLATIAVKIGAQSKPVPCVVDRLTKRVWLSVDGEWLDEAEWLKMAPSPQ